MKNLKSLLIFFGIFFALILGVVYFASTRFSEEEIQSLVKSSLEKTFPESSVKVGKVEYTLGPSITFIINDVQIKLKEGRPGEDLFSVKETFLKIPIWSLLSDGGEISLKVDSPQVSYVEYDEDSNNWKIAMGKEFETASAKNNKSSKKKNSTEDKIKAKDGSSELLIPAFFAKSKINIRFDNTDLIYQTVGKLKGQVQIRKFLIKNLSLKESLAYELQSTLELEEKGKGRTFTNILLIGEFGTPNFVRSGEINSKGELKLTDIVHPAVKTKIPSFSGRFNIGNNKKKNLNGSVDITFGTLLFGSLSFDLGETIRVKDIKLTSNFDSVVNFLPNKIPGLNMNGSQLQVNGDLSLGGGKVFPNLSFNTTNSIIFNSPEVPGLETRTNLIGSMSSQILNLQTITKVFSGEVLSKTSINLPKDLSKISLSSIGKVRSELNVNNVKFSDEFIKNFLAKGKEEKASNASKESKSQKSSDEIKDQQVAKVLAPFLLPNFSTNLRFREVDIAGTKLNLNALIAGKGSKVGSDNIKMTFGKGTAGLTFLTQFQRSDISFKYDFNTKDFPLSGLKVFLPTDIQKVGGSAFLKTEGEVSIQKSKPVYSVGLSGEIRNGEIKGLNLKKYIAEYVEKIPKASSFMNKKDIDISDKFKTLSFKSLLKNDHFKVSQLQFIGVSNDLEIKGNANVFPPETKKISVASLTLNDPRGKVGKALKKSTGKTQIPVRLEGPGYSLAPDYGYTLKKVVSSAAKVQGKKVLKKQGKKLLDKYLKGDAKEKAGKLLKGLFN